MDVSDFDFDLPDELVAQHPAPRGCSRLLGLDRVTGERRHSSIADLPALLRPGDLLVVNDTRVFAARLLGRRVPSGGVVECLLLTAPERVGDPSPARFEPSESRVPDPGSRAGRFEPSESRVPDPGSQAARFEPSESRVPDPGSRAARFELSESRVPDPGSRLVQALMHPGQKLKPGARVRFEGDAGVLMAEVLERHFHGRRSIRLWSESAVDVDTLVDALGHVPLPPYIKRADTPADRERYQTVFARASGSVAAPTAGLHFTTDLLAALERRGIERAGLTLHVGYGTFKPVRAGRVVDHVVDPEPYDIPPATADAVTRARDEGRRVIAVGTTTTRALEDAALRGRGRIASGPADASLFIHPGHRFQVIDGLLTNFHLPASSLLMLVAAFAGRERVLEAYREAVAQKYRFYSYGDAMLIL
jgi:S-adenosylmethionine:tRNA ribosyltransferase-isomerase